MEISLPHRRNAREISIIRLFSNTLLAPRTSGSMALEVDAQERITV